MKISIGKYMGKYVFFDRSKAQNGHMVILGATGSGKTTEIVRIAIELARNGVTVLAFDTNNIFADSQIHPKCISAFKHLCNEIDVYNDGISIPLFTPFTFSDGDSEKLVDTIDTVTEALSKTFKFGVRQKATLRSAVETVSIKGLYQKHGIQSLSKVLEDMRTTRAIEVKDRIAQVTDHNIFTDGELLIKEGKINLLRLSKFSDDTQKTIMEIISAVLWKYAAKEKFENDVYMIFDECQNMDLGKNGMIGKILVEGRRFHYNLILSTQVMSLDSHIAKLMTQAALILNFRPAKSEVRKIASLIDSNREDVWASILSRLKIGEFIASGTMVCEDKVINDPLLVTAYIDDEIQKGVD